MKRSTRILAQFQQPKIGDWMPMTSNVNETTAFKVKAFATNRWLLWTKPDSTWAWTLTPRDGGQTRLKQRYPWESPALAIFTLLLLEYGDFPMIRKVLKGIKLPRRTDEFRRCNRGSDRVCALGSGHLKEASIQLLATHIDLAFYRQKQKEITHEDLEQTKDRKRDNDAFRPIVERSLLSREYVGSVVRRFDHFAHGADLQRTPTPACGRNGPTPIHCCP